MGGGVAALGRVSKNNEGPGNSRAFLFFIAFVEFLRRLALPRGAAYRPRKAFGVLYSWHSTQVFLACSLDILQTWGLWHCLHFMPVSSI